MSHPTLGTLAEKVLKLLEEDGPLSTGQLVARTGLSRPRAAAAVKELLAAGAIVPTTPKLHARNRAYRVRDRY